MHHALYLPELVGPIVEYTIGHSFRWMRHPENSGDVMTLLGLNRLFSELTLNFIWQEVDALRLFVCFLPTEIWDLTEEYLEGFPNSGRIDLTWKFKREFSVEEWERFDYYAKRVRRLHLDNDFGGWYRGDYLISPTVFKYLFQSRSMVPFPLLNSIDINECFYVSIFNYFQPNLFRSPLRTLRIEYTSYQDDSKMDLNILMELVMICSGLKELEIRHNRENVVNWPTNYRIFDVIRNNPIQHLTLDTYLFNTVRCTEFFELISLSPQLVTLKIEFSPTLMARSQYPKLDLPNLRHLCMYDCLFEEATKFLELFQKPRLIDLSTEISTFRGSNQGVGEHLLAIERILDSAVLKDLTICLWAARYVNEQTFGASAFDFEFIRPLFQFSNMINFDYSLPQDFSSFDDTMLMQISSSWPRLQEFTLWGPLDYRTKVTFPALVEFSRRCSQLRHFQLVFQDNFVPADFPEDDRRTSQLMHLYGGPAELSDINGAVESLMKAFPKLEPSGLYGTVGTYEIWTEVRDLIETRQKTIATS